MRNTRHLLPADLLGRRWRGLIRESTQAQQDKFSPERQRSDIIRAAGELGMVGGDRWYERVGSGETEGAAEIAAALADASRGEFDVLVCFATSRLARNRYEAVRLKRDFARAGVVIYFVAERLISGTYAGALSEGISEVLDEHANEERRMYVAGGMRERHLSGRWQGRIPVGFRKQLVDFPDGSRGWDGALDIDPETAPLVRRIFTEAASGAPLSRIAVGLNVDGLRRVEGQPWAPNALREVLRNQVYMGMLVRYQRDRAPHYYDTADKHDGRRELGRPFPGLVDDALWQAAQPREGVPWKSATHVYPLSAVTRCGRCGSRMQGAFSGKYRYYRCAGRLAGVCEARHARADKAEAAFAGWLEDIELPDDWRQKVARIEVRTVVSGERDRTQKIAEQLTRLRNLYAWGDISETDYREQSTSLKSEQGVMVKPSLGNLETIAEALRHVGASWASIPEDRKRDLPGRLLRSIIIEEGLVTTYVARPELKPLLDLGVVEATVASIGRPRYAVRYSA